MTKKPLIEVLHKRSNQRVVWFLRQAGRYLPEYRKIREKVSFIELSENPSLASEVTLQPISRFDLDAAIIFSDILTPISKMGLELRFAKDHGPIIEPPIQKSCDLSLLSLDDFENKVGFVAEVITKTREKLNPNVALFGFCGAPMTLAYYMVDGSKNMTKGIHGVKRLLMTDPDTLRGLFEVLTEMTVRYARMQVEAGIDAFMIFDTWAGILSPFDYQNFYLPYLKTISDAMQEMNVPTILYPGQGLDHFHSAMNHTQFHAYHVDWRMSLSALLSSGSVDGRVVQGNLDPASLLLPSEKLTQRVNDILSLVESSKLGGHIFNVGHGLTPSTPPESLSTVISAIRDM